MSEPVKCNLGDGPQLELGGKVTIGPWRFVKWDYGKGCGEFVLCGTGGPVVLIPIECFDESRVMHVLP